MTPRILSIAGSDSGGGAGIQADIKTITMLGGHAMTAITAVTAQNSRGVNRVDALSADAVIAQIDAVVSDFGADAVKIGMLGSAEIAGAVAASLHSSFQRKLESHATREHRAERDSSFRWNDGKAIILDPVMVATSGAILADTATIAAFRPLMDIASLVTPNLVELDALGGPDAILSHGCALLIKGGHGAGDTITDRLIMPDGSETLWTDPRIDTPHSHGTGCTLSSAIATYLGHGLPLIDSVARARHFVRMTLRDAPEFVASNGPMGHGAVRLDATLPGPMLNQVTLGCGDYAESLAFYTALGLTQIVDSPPHYARFESAGGGTLSIEATGGPAGDAMVYLECADLDARCAVLAAAGIHVDQMPADQTWGWREARLRDPHGNQLCLYYAGENRRYPPWRI